MVAWKSTSISHEINMVLIVTRDSEMADVWKTLFEQKGCEVAHESSGGAAMQIARKISPALIVLDLNLPHAERVRLCRELRHTTRGTILLLAPKGDMAEISEYLYAGADEFLSTPISPMALLIKSMAWLVRQDRGMLKDTSSQLNM